MRCGETASITGWEEFVPHSKTYPIQIRVGWAVGEVDGHFHADHVGADEGYLAAMELAPDDGIAVVGSTVTILTMLNLTPGFGRSLLKSCKRCYPPKTEALAATSSTTPPRKAWITSIQPLVKTIRSTTR